MARVEDEALPSQPGRALYKGAGCAVSVSLYQCPCYKSMILEVTIYIVEEPFTAALNSGQMLLTLPKTCSAKSVLFSTLFSLFFFFHYNCFSVTVSVLQFDKLAQCLLPRCSHLIGATFYSYANTNIFTL